MGNTNPSLPHKFFPSGLVDLHPKIIFWLNGYCHPAHYWFTVCNKELIIFSLYSPYQLQLSIEVPSPVGGIWVMCTVLEIADLYFENNNHTQCSWFNPFLSYSVLANVFSLFIHFVSFIKRCFICYCSFLMQTPPLPPPPPQLMLFLRKWCRTLIKVC